MPSRFTLLASTAAMLAAGAVAGLPAHAAPNGGGCALQGTAKFTHGPNTTAHAFTYTFTGALSQCQSSSSGPAGGKVGTLLPAKGSGTCQQGSTAGVAYVAWSDGTGTVIKYTTTDAGAEVLLQGTVLPKYKVGTKVYKSTRYVGDGALGNLAFEADPQQCAGSGVTSAGIAGFTGLGSS